MDSIVLEPAVKEMLLVDCQDFLRSEKWYVPLYFTGIWEYKRFIGMPKGVGSFYNQVHVRIQVFNFPYSERDTLSTWVSVAWRARKVRSFPEMVIMC